MALMRNDCFAWTQRLLEAEDSPTSPKGEPYEVALQNLAKVMAMPATGAQPPQDLSQLARGYEQGQLIPVQDLGFANPCGGVFSSANDMAKLLSFLVRDNAPRDDGDGSGQPMDSATVRRWLTERAYVNPSNLNCDRCRCVCSLAVYINSTTVLPIIAIEQLGLSITRACSTELRFVVGCLLWLYVLHVSSVCPGEVTTRSGVYRGRICE